MKEVTVVYLDSPQNPRVKGWSGLKTKKGRLQSGEFLVEGIRLVEELLGSSLDVQALLWDVGTDELPDSLLETAGKRGITLYELSPNAFAAVSDTVTPQGVIAIAKIPQRDADTAPTASHALLLDGVQDPGNAGTLLRTADAFGIREVCCGTGTVDPFAPKVVRASMGGLFRLPVEVRDSAQYIQAWRTAWPEGQVAVTTPTAPVTCDKVDFRVPSLIVIGSEAFGVSEQTATSATVEVRIPMTGLTESLNAAIAGAVLLYEVYRQRQ